MVARISVSLILVVSGLLAGAACAKPPKQVEAPDALSDKGADMSNGDDPRNGNVKGDGAVAAADAPKAGEADMHAKCCVECKKGLAADRSGQPAASIPCADFTAALSPWCLEHFRGKKTMASECK